ncbi:F-box/LRR-repeat MAX2 homolog [Typha latifolia]|uniref:F-box/LRR-repeat MAX2 homolog n=1 Tax=Typha latifolia TaxID=4733 RepID=UPI003C300944
MAVRGGGGGGGTQLHDLPEPILTQVISLIEDVRTRNAVSLVCSRWRTLERSTRTSLSLRGNVRNPFLLPTCFSAVSCLDLSLLSPWGHPFLPPPPPNYFQQEEQNLQPYHLSNQQLIAQRLGQAFPSVASLVVYAREPSTIYALAPQWPRLLEAKLVRWHQRPHHSPGSDLAPLLANCSAIDSLDLSDFYCWTEDIPPALQAYPTAAASLTRLNLLLASASEGFGRSELAVISESCTNLRHLIAPCIFNPRYINFVGDDALLDLATNCPRLTLLHLVDPSTLSPAPAAGGGEQTQEDAGITAAGLQNLFAALRGLEDVALDLCHNVQDAGPAFESLSHRCPRIKSLKLGHFQSICKAAWLHLDGVAVCGGLESLCIKNSSDLTDAGLAAIARGCRRISKFEIHGCNRVTETGIKRLASTLRSTLKEVRISGCELLDSTRSLRALDPVRDRLERLHFDCVWVKPGLEEQPAEDPENAADGSDVDEFEDGVDCSHESARKKCRYSEEAGPAHYGNGVNSLWSRNWERLRYLSLWFPAGEVLTPLLDALESCPVLEEISIKVEGDCRTCPKPTQRVFGLSFLAQYQRLAKMKLDCGEAIGYALTAPMGQMDLSLWERFYLHGIGDLNLYELDYWPPQDKEVNQRSLSLPATGLIQECLSLRKLFIHGTTHEHFMRFFLMMQNLRDVQLREDYYPAPENDMSTEMRVDSCSRFEDALNNRVVPD